MMFQLLLLTILIVHTVDGQDFWNGGIAFPSCRVDGGRDDYLTEENLRATLHVESQGFPEDVFDAAYFLSSASFRNKTGVSEGFVFIATAAESQRTFLFEVVQDDTVSYGVASILFRGTYNLSAGTVRPMSLGVVDDHRLLFMHTNNTMLCINVSTDAQTACGCLG